MNSSVVNIHEENKTPHVAIGVVLLIATLVPLILIAFGNDIFVIYGWLGTIATFGFLVNYALVTIAAPVYLYKEKALKVKDTALSAITFIILLIPIVGSVYPLPEYPYNLFPFIFLAWLAVGVAWFVIRRVKNPDLVSNIKSDTHRINEQFKSGVEDIKAI